MIRGKWELGNEEGRRESESAEVENRMTFSPALNLTPQPRYLVTKGKFMSGKAHNRFLEMF